MNCASGLCSHCGSPVPAGRADVFCCAGCAYVHDLLHSQGLEHYYQLRGSAPAAPVPQQSLREQDYEWLFTLGAAAETGSAAAELRLAVQGLSCIGCVWLVEKVFARHAGGLRIMVDVVRGELLLTWQPGVFDLVAFASDMQSFGYLLGPARQEGDPSQATTLGRKMTVCGAFAMNAMAFSLPAYFGMPQDFLFAPWFEFIAVASATLAMLVGGSWFIEKAWRSLAAGQVHIDLPIALGIIAAYLGSLAGWIAGVKDLQYFDFVAIFIFLMLAGRHLQQSALERNRRRLMRDSSVPEQVRCLTNNDEKPTLLSVQDLQPGHLYEIKPGQMIPVASRLHQARTSISLEWINGESEAQMRVDGQMLPSGALNITSQPLCAESLEAWEQSTLKHLLEARKNQDYRDRGLERLLRGYLLVVLAVGLGGAAWWLAQGAGLAQAAQVMISIFVVSCPCALGVAVPLAEELAVSRASRAGVFVRTHAFWKRLLQVRRVVFDKTGTLTLENPVLQQPEKLLLLGQEEQTALRTLVCGNLHPVSRSLFDAVGPGELWTQAEKHEVIGQGLRLTDAANRTWTLGRPGAWGLEATEPGESVFACQGRVLAVFAFQEALRSESADEVSRLQQRGLEVCILSGDRGDKVATAARQLHLPDECWQAGLTPEEKAAWVRDHDQADTLYVGDGANDSLAFDEALCTASPVTGRSFLEQKADFYFLGHSLRFISPLLQVAATHRRATRRVFAFSVLYNAATVAAGLAGHLNPLAAAVLMPLSSLATLGLVSWTFRRSMSAQEMPRHGEHAPPPQVNSPIRPQICTP